MGQVCGSECYGPGRTRMALFFSRAEELEQLTSDRSEITIYRVGRSTLVTRATGHPDVQAVELLMRRSDDLIARAGSIDVVHDWFGVTAYRADIRARITPWAEKTKAQHRGIHIGASSSIVRMGVTMVRLVAGSPLHAYDSLEDLERVLAEILRKAA